MTLNELREFYIDHLFTVLTPYWMKHGIDHTHGGFYTCFNNNGDKLLSTEKYIWSQGRFLWMLSRLLYNFTEYVDDQTAEEWKSAADRGAEFLKMYALLPNGKSAWVLAEDGTPIMADPENNEYDLSINADEFLIYGMAEYARASENVEYFHFALNLFDSVRERLKTGDYKTAPHVIPHGFKAHADPMIMVETANELSDIAGFFNHPSKERLLTIAKDAMHEVVDDFVIEDDTILLELIKEDGSPAGNTLLGSYANPGHSIEDAWFIMHLAKKTGDERSLNAAVNVVKWMTTVGWDSEYGGIFQFVHKDGGQPRGEISEENANDHMIQELSENWYNKLWWVHSESLYSLLLAYEHSHNEWFMQKYREMHEYVFKTFPNPDKSLGEWIQIRNREGKPEEKLIALPVKDPYHITRAFMHIIKSLDRQIGRSGADSGQ